MGRASCNFIKIVCFAISVFAALAVSEVEACNVPVFKYATQWWSAGTFRLMIFQDRDFTPEEDKKLQQAQDKIRRLTHPSVLEIMPIRVGDGALDGDEAGVWAGKKPLEMPWGVLVEPMESGRAQEIWEGGLDQLDALLKPSPKVAEMAGLLGKGNAAVWLVLKRGNEEKHAAMVVSLEGWLKDLESRLELPSDMLDGLDPDKASVAEQFVGELKIKFAVLSLDEKDADETVLVRTILKNIGESDEASDEPVAVPVYGRGRALVALMGKSFEKRTIESACQFLVGPCSCEIKGQNPGVDLFCPVDWDALIEEPGKPIAPPELVGPTAAPRVVQPQQPAQQSKMPAPAKRAGQTISGSRDNGLPIAGILAAVFLVGAAGLSGWAFGNLGKKNKRRV